MVTKRQTVVETEPIPKVARVNIHSFIRLRFSMFADSVCLTNACIIIRTTLLMAKMAKVGSVSTA